MVVIKQTTITDSVGVNDAVDNGILTEKVTISEQIKGTTGVSVLTTTTVTDALTETPIAAPHKSRSKPHFIFKVAGVEIPIKDFSLTRGISDGMRGRITTWEGYVSDADIDKDVELIFENPDDGTQISIFKGLITAYSSKPPSKLVTLEVNGFEIELQNDIYMDDTTGVFEYTQTRADVIAAAILNGTNFTLVECPTDFISVRYDYVTRWDALRLIADITNKELWVDDSRGVHIGTRGGSATITNFISKEVSYELDGLINRVVVIGGNSGNGKVPIGVAEDSGSINTYGVRAHVEKVPQIRDKTTAVLLAKAYLNRFNRLNIQLEAKVPITTTTITIKEGMTINVDGNDYKISTIRINPNSITLSANPSYLTESLLDYIKRRLNEKTNAATGSSVFYNETPMTITAYEELALSPDYYGGQIVKTLEIGGVTYEIYGVMHFYVPDNFTAKDAVLYIRSFGTESIAGMKVVINGTVVNLTSDGTASDGDELYTVTIPATSIKAGWNDLYFVW